MTMLQYGLIFLGLFVGFCFGILISALGQASRGNIDETELYATSIGNRCATCQEEHCLFDDEENPPEEKLSPYMQELTHGKIASKKAS